MLELKKTGRRLVCVCPFVMLSDPFWDGDYYWRHFGAPICFSTRTLLKFLKCRSTIPGW